MQRQKFSREFKFEAVKLVRDRGVSVAQAARDLDVQENVLRKRVRFRRRSRQLARYARIFRLVKPPYSPMIASPDRQVCGLKAGMKLRSRPGSQRFSSLSS